jgi:hypothetical protein
MRVVPWPVERLSDSQEELSSMEAVKIMFVSLYNCEISESISWRLLWHMPLFPAAAWWPWVSTCTESEPLLTLWSGHIPTHWLSRSWRPQIETCCRTLYSKLRYPFNILSQLFHIAYYMCAVKMLSVVWILAARTPMPSLHENFSFLALQPLFGPWPLFSFLILHRQQDSLDGGSARRKAST